MNKETAVINEVKGIPVITGASAISPFIELRRLDNHAPMSTVLSFNCQTGEALVAVMDGEVFKMDESGNVALKTVYLDRKKYYIAFK
jgi:hypothetical protein